VRRIATGDEVLPPVQDPPAVLALRAGLDPGGVGPSARFGEGEARHFVRGHDRVQILLPLGLSAVHVHRCRTRDDWEDRLELCKDQAGPTGFLVQQHLPQVGEVSATHLLGHVKRPETQLGRPLPDLHPLVLHGFEGPGFLDLLAMGFLEWADLSIDELPQRRAELQELVWNVEDRHRS
jgi:hypothetical protein